MSCDKDENEKIKHDAIVEFIVELPKNTPEGDIYIAGSFKHEMMEDWAPDHESGKAERTGNTAKITLIYKKENLPVTISYKWTRGGWDKVEKGALGQELGNRTVTITKSIEINNKVENWADLMDNHEKSTVVGNLEVVELSYDGFTDQSQKTRKIRIWTPEGYDQNNSLRYPVIYMHDGQNIFDTMTAFAGEWEADEAMENFIKEGNNGAIIVAIDNSSARMGEYIYNHDFVDNYQYENIKTGHLYMNFIVEVVKPYVDNKYNTSTDKQDTTIAGSSLGGLIALFGGLEHLDVFGNILAFSTSTWAVNEELWKSYLKQHDYNDYLNTKFFFYVGTNSDGDVNWPENYKTILKEVGFSNFKIVVGEGFTHNELAWRTHLPLAFQWLLK